MRLPHRPPPGHDLVVIAEANPAPRHVQAMGV
jgi:hypothetical protein